MSNLVGKYIKELSKILADSVYVSILCHINPDGDAIGSMLAVYHYLTAKGKKCSMISPGPIPGFLLWMNCADKIIVASEEEEISRKRIEESDTVIMVDFNHPSRVEDLDPLIDRNEKKVILIDHHPEPNIRAHLVISEPTYSSASELIFDLAEELGDEPINLKTFIEAVFVGMMTDTGNFNYGTFDGNTLRKVARMLDMGLDKDYITNKVYNNFTPSRMKLMGLALNERMVVIKELHTAYIYLSREDLKKYSHITGDTEGFVNLPLSIDGIVFTLLFLERNDHIKISLRSKGGFEANRFSRNHFNGGGHSSAAGGKSLMKMKECLSYFENILHGYRDKLNDAYNQVI